MPSLVVTRVFVVSDRYLTVSQSCGPSVMYDVVIPPETRGGRWVGAFTGSCVSRPRNGSITINGCRSTF